MSPPSPRFPSNLRAVIVCCLTAFLAVPLCGPAYAAEMEQSDGSRSKIAENAAEVRQILQDAQQGKSISNMMLGSFIAGLLKDICERDAELSAYFHKNHFFIESYLMNRFQYHPAEEVAAIDAMVGSARPPLRLAARWGLESLRHIPDSDDPVPKQEQDRRDLVVALTALGTALQTAAGR